MNIKLLLFSTFLLLSGFSTATDTDNDGLPDDWELANGRDPLVADYIVSVGGSHDCLLDDSGVTCSGSNRHGETDVPPLSNPTQVSTGGYHTCALDDNGVRCWGNNSRGQTDVPALSNPTQVSTGGYHTCALDDNGVTCWGYNSNGQTDVPALSNPTQVSVGGSHTCALDDSGVNCWGKDLTWQTRVPELSNPRQVSAGGNQTCAVDDTGVICWGLSSDFVEDVYPPPLSKAIQVSVGPDNVCAIYDIGVVCWGRRITQINSVAHILIDPDGDGYSNHDAADTFPLDASEWLDSDLDGIGNNTDTDDDGDNVVDSTDPWPLDSKYSTDTDGDGLPDSYEISQGYDPNNASDAQLDSDEDGLTRLQEFGYGSSDKDTDSDYDTLPDGWEVDNGRDPSFPDYHLASGRFRNCAIVDAGLTCWGYDPFSYIFEEMTPLLTKPSHLSVEPGPCVIDINKFVCWSKQGGIAYPNVGGNLGGYLPGDGQKTVPDYFPALWLFNPTQFSYNSGGTTCFVDDNGVACTGYSDREQITIPQLSNPIQVTGGYLHTCALDDSGVVCWGDNLWGQTNVPSLSNPTQVIAGEASTCALDDTGVVCWGNNTYDQTTVPALSNPRLISTHRRGNHTCAMDDGGVTCWGYNSNGQTDVPALSNPTQVSVGGSHTCALDDTGVVCWGSSLNGKTIVPNLLIDPDGDGYSTQGGADAFPLDASEWLDTDLDGIGNNSDAFPNNALYSADNDSDGMPDEWETKYGLDPNDASDATSDQDNDGITALDEFLAGTIPSGSLDIDGNEDYDALTDGLLLLRGMFGLDGSALVTGTIASDATYTESVDIESRIETLGDLADIDGNGQIDALTDGLLTLRYLFGLQGDTLINGVVADDATRKTAEEIEAHLETLMPAL